ncbi:MAG TPA: ribokinase [Actinobacteria bacterium]|nr:ribokinase [Actinomycetota bacterium]
MVDVVVVGSVNQDLVVRVPRHPIPGETVLGLGLSTWEGGKGANQAVVAARLGARVAFVGRVGADEAGGMLLAGLAAEGIDTRWVAVDGAVPSGTALITVDETGENAIVVVPGANHALGVADVRAAAETLEGAAVTLLQLEVPLEVVVEAARLAGGTVVLNPAPARELPGDLLGRVDVLVPNRHELAALVGTDDPAAARALGVAAVVVTLGAEGAALVTDEGVVEVPAPVVEAVDTTGAGDAFCGTLAARLALGDDLVGAVRSAVEVAARATTRPGARGGYPPPRRRR